jgi:peroxiredoxin Q/BCP
MLEVGSAAPEFTALDQDGREVTLAGLRGRWIALWWYPKASTPG